MQKVLYSQAYALAKRGKYNDAIEFYKKALDIKSDNKKLNAKAWYGQGNALYELERYDEAIECYNKALKIDPTCKMVINKLLEALRTEGYGCYKNKEYGKMFEYYNKALEIGQNYKIKEADDYSAQGAVFYDSKQYDAAIECYEAALKIDPSYKVVITKLLEVYNNKQNYVFYLKACYCLTESALKYFESFNLQNNQVPVQEFKVELMGQ